MPVSTNNNLLEVRNLKTYYFTSGGVVKAVDGVSYSVAPGEMVAMVGESGCGKSAGAYSVLGLVPSPPGKIVGGEIFFDGKNLLTMGAEELRKLRGSAIGMIFQDPSASLNPVLTIGLQLTEAIREHLGLGNAAATTRAVELLQKVGISNPEGRLAQYPHQLSGGMKQRVMIAMALSCDPKLIIADEPTTALDVTIQAQILELLRNLSRELNVAVILITHNLGIVARYADRVNVMYAGRIVESGTTRDVYGATAHPYTEGLLGSVPRLDLPRRETLAAVEGQPPDLTSLGAGCAFRPRCAFAKDVCAGQYPAFAEVSPGHEAACWRTQA